LLIIKNMSNMESTPRARLWRVIHRGFPELETVRLEDSSTVSKSGLAVLRQPKDNLANFINCYPACPPMAGYS